MFLQSVLFSVILKMNKSINFSFFVYIIVLCINAIWGISLDDQNDIELATAIFITERCPIVTEADGESVLKSIEDIRLCIDQAGDKVMSDIGSVLFQEKDKIAAFLNKKCENLENETLSCIDNNLAGFKQCLTEEEQVKSNTFRKVIAHILHFICSENGYKMAPVYAGDGMNCFLEHSLQTDFCLRQTLKKYNKIILPSDFVQDSNCDELKTLETCLLNAYNTCPIKIASKFTESYIKSLMEELSCPLNVNEPYVNDQVLNRSQRLYH